MELLSLIKETSISIRLKNVINDLLGNDNTKISEAKKNLKDSCGIIYTNVINKTSNGCCIMLKTSSLSYIYDFNYSTENLLLIGGVRKNAGTK